MKVVILAGGYGTRLSEETDVKPKPMVEIGNKPILWHILKFYSSYGFNDFIICLGYKGQFIKNYFLNYLYNSNDLKIDIENKTTNILSKEIMSIHGTADIGIEADGGNILTKATQIHFNSPSNEPAVHSADIPLSAVEASITARVPQHEPWDQHENLDPVSYTSLKTQAGTEQQSVYYDTNGNLQYKDDPNTTGPQ